MLPVEYGKAFLMLVEQSKCNVYDMLLVFKPILLELSSAEVLKFQACGLPPPNKCSIYASKSSQSLKLWLEPRLTTPEHHHDKYEKKL